MSTWYQLKKITTKDKSNNTKKKTELQTIQFDQIKRNIVVYSPCKHEYKQQLSLRKDYYYLKKRRESLTYCLGYQNAYIFSLCPCKSLHRDRCRGDVKEESAIHVDTNGRMHKNRDFLESLELCVVAQQY